MQNIFTKLLYTGLPTVASSTLPACTSDSPDIDSAEEKREVRFGASDVSRALTSSVNYTGYEFTVFGDMKYTGAMLSFDYAISTSEEGTAGNPDVCDILTAPHRRMHNSEDSAKVSLGFGQNLYKKSDYRQIRT